MELDEMRAAWQGQRHFNLQILREGKLKNALRPLVCGQYVQIAGGIFLQVLFGPFWVEHRQQPHLMLAGLALHLYGLLLLVSAAKTILLARQFEYSKPVVDLQKSLADLRLWRASVEQPVFALLGCFIWIPFIQLCFYGLGADLWVRAPLVLEWLAVSGAVCAAVVIVVIGLARQRGWERFRGLVERSVIGRSIQSAQRELDEIERFSTVM